MKFIKNLHYSLSVFLGVPCLFLFVEILFSIASVGRAYPLAEVFVYMNLSMLAALLMYVVFGFKFVFQYVVIDDSGITVCFFKKTLQRFRWNYIASIQESSFVNVPSYKIVLENENVIYLIEEKQLKKLLKCTMIRKYLVIK